MAKALERVRNARISLKNRGTSDIANAEAIEDLTTKAQEIIVQMNAAKLVALREAEAPFLAQLEEIDKEMAVYVTLMG